MYHTFNWYGTKIIGLYSQYTEQIISNVLFVFSGRKAGRPPRRKRKSSGAGASGSDPKRSFIAETTEMELPDLATSNKASWKIEKEKNYLSTNTINCYLPSVFI